MPAAAFPLAVVAFVTGGAIAGTQGPFAGTPLDAEEPKAERLYRDGGRVVGSPILDLQAAERACPAGHTIRRQETREDGPRTYLVWTLRCR
jgi:hypothetical protein